MVLNNPFLVSWIGSIWRIVGRHQHPTNNKNNKIKNKNNILKGKGGETETETETETEKDKMESSSSPTSSPNRPISSSIMDGLLGLLRIRIKRGVNLAVRDVRSSDPYVVVKMGKQKLKTRVIRKDVNPEWNEDLTLSVSDPNLPIKLTVYDHDTFTKDDKMGDADIPIKHFLEALKMDLSEYPSGTTITRVQPCRTNCLSEESSVIWKDRKLVQEMCLRLRNVECGEVELDLNWIELPKSY